MTADKLKQPYFPLSLQISARAWQQFELDPRRALTEGTAPLFQIRQLAAALQQRTAPAKPVRAGELNLLALLNRALRHVAVRYLDLRGCTVDGESLLIAGRQLKAPALSPALQHCVELFPPAAVWLGSEPSRFLRGTRGAEKRRETLVELFILAVQNRNRAARDYRPLFDDRELLQRSRYRQTLLELDRELEQEAIPGLFSGSLLALLRAPLDASPESLAGQLGFVQQRWGGILPEDLLQELLVAFAIIQEEELQRGFGGGPPPVLTFGGVAEHEPEAFSPDTDWMPKVVLIAKTIYVWLDQLSKRHGRPIHRLDDIPDEELDRLARWGFNSLWLIGLWQRSPASQKIKRICGNPEAEASAYSLYDYAIAWDLGGDEALARLEQRCLQRGIRLASDVVPNHTGLDSRWMREHPDWFIQGDHPPYPAYHFSGPDLYDDPEITVQIEDGYYDHSDAAVVFRHQDHRSGRVRYIYHGNDGTHMPWNDTAQLNYLIPEVREAMIRTIVHIARRFRVIRFDAAMTLAKKHYQRLWFPQPGGGEGVPSRAEHWMSKEAFEKVFPVEFWREVVDRVAAEVPDTLLIAEAFWLMEGYFVRTLGMHRVYNSAFMNMLKREDNAKYRQVLRNTLEFEPGILQRFVNFMNNPDEDTAVEQFGKADKYFGVAVLLATLPGLPMFGHGQVEGLKEKYGMEYRRAYWDETVDEAFVRHHENQVFPLLRLRHLFSGAELFQMYDFYSDGRVNDDVYAFSNGAGDQRALVVYHNRHGATDGWIQRSVPRQQPGGPQSALLAESLGVRAGERWYFRFHDHSSGLDYLRTGDELTENGLHLSLGPYQYHVYLDFAALFDEDGAWGELYRRIGHAPVASLDRELRKIRFRPVSDAFRELVEAPLLQSLCSLLGGPVKNLRQHPDYQRFSGRLTRFVDTLGHFAHPAPDATAVTGAILAQLDQLRKMAALKGRGPAQRMAISYLQQLLYAATDGPLCQVLIPYLLLHRLAGPQPSSATTRRSAAWIEEYLLGEALQEAVPGDEAAAIRLLVENLVRQQNFWLPGRRRQDFHGLLTDSSVQAYLQVHWHDGTQWFNKERWEQLTSGLLVAAACAAADTFSDQPNELLGHLADSYERLSAARRLAAESGYRLGDLLALSALKPPVAPNLRRKKSLKILMVASEVTPFAKSGGLADVAGSLPRALRALGHDVRIIMPYYRTIATRGDAKERDAAAATVALDATPRRALLHEGELNGVPVYFVDHADFYDRADLYGTGEGDFADNAQRFGYFDRAVLELLPKIGFRPDILHLNDWQTGLIPALLKTEYADDPFYAGCASLLTIHNLGYQGLFSARNLETLDLDPWLFGVGGLEYHSMLSFLKAGLTQADLLNTVSSTYCREIQTPEMGIGFDGILRGRSDDLFGIVNGLDPKQWNPATDPALPVRYGADTLENKAQCKRALQRELGLTESADTPIVAMITRLATQKGLDIVEDAWHSMMQRPVQFVLLGTGEKEHMERFDRLRHSYPGRVSINLSFDDDLSRRIYAGSDIFLMPSRYEPCGLGQLIALRYGVIPLARRTGGLADTITDPADNRRQANGYLFSDPSAGALLHTLDRALTLYASQEDWTSMVRRGMRQDFSWTRSAEQYLDLYRLALE
ncbi:glycogen synthase GlgA [Trichloromonas sp.]|uniref:glycogen synthase GlgA n=1 Tax=Trichloromonas sp. TaxID=3069249 RepID=UPI003D81B748